MTAFKWVPKNIDTETGIPSQVVFKKGNSIKGYIAPSDGGWGYSFGKPSDSTVMMFTKNEGHYTFEEAMNKLEDRVIENETELYQILRKKVKNRIES